MASAETHDLIAKARRIYDERYKPALEATHMHSFVAIEPESGDYFLGPTLSDAAEACHAVHPDRRACVLRVGHRAAVHMGGML
jgi:hypothetical protein